MRKFRTELSALMILVLLFAYMPMTAMAAKTYTGTITKDKIFFRSRATTESGWILRFKQGDKIEISAESGDFYKATFNGKTGYVMKKFVSLSSAAQKALSTTDTSTDKTEQNSSETTAPAKTETDIVASKPSAALSGNTGAITKDNIFFRSIPSTESSWSRRFKKDDVVEIIGQSGDFYQVTFNGKSGYVMKKFVTLSPDAQKALSATDTNSNTPQIEPPAAETAPAAETTAPSENVQSGSAYTATIVKDNIFFRSRPTTDSGWSRRFKQNDVVEILGESGDFYHVTFNGKTGYVMKKFVTLSSAAAAMLAAGSDTAASTGTATEKLVWFDTGKNLFKPGVTFQVKDVKTGNTWNCKCLYSGYHLDAEPLTASDTEKMKAAYGGTINYVRRAVLVNYNGHVYAASIYGEAHGDQSITNNNFNGQFCIHFTGSTTSGTKVVDSDHQAAVNEASKASW